MSHGWVDKGGRHDLILDDASSSQEFPVLLPAIKIPLYQIWAYPSLVQASVSNLNSPLLPTEMCLYHRVTKGGRFKWAKKLFYTKMYIFLKVRYMFWYYSNSYIVSALVFNQFKPCPSLMSFSCP